MSNHSKKLFINEAGDIEAAKDKSQRSTGLGKVAQVCSTVSQHHRASSSWSVHSNDAGAYTAAEQLIAFAPVNCHLPVTVTDALAYATEHMSTAPARSMALAVPAFYLVASPETAAHVCCTATRPPWAVRSSPHKHLMLALASDAILAIHGSHGKVGGSSPEEFASRPRGAPKKTANSLHLNRLQLHQHQHDPGSPCRMSVLPCACAAGCCVPP
jgi:hypothetical protein